MDALIRELETLTQRPKPSPREAVGAMLAATMRFSEVLNERMVAIQALAAAIAMQPQIDVAKLHDDYLDTLKAHFDSRRSIPVDLRDIASSIQLAASERPRV